MGFVLPDGASIFQAKTTEIEVAVAVTVVINAINAVLRIATGHDIALAHKDEEQQQAISNAKL